MIHYEYINERGKALADNISQRLGEANALNEACRAIMADDKDAIVFIGSLGICVRKILPMVHDKYTDPAVICVDSTGKWVIPVLCGHIGGANELARTIATAIGGEAVITTQSDNLGLWALDTLAREYGWEEKAHSREDKNRAIAAFVNEQPTALYLHQEDEGTRYLSDTCPPHVIVNPTEGEYAVEIIVKDNTLDYHCVKSSGESASKASHTLTLAFGCKKDAPESCADKIIYELNQRGVDTHAITTVATIELKANEQMFDRLCELLPWAERKVYTAEELKDVEVPNPSEKVREVTGCYGVAEGCALAEGQKLLIEKTKGECDGSHFTFALSQNHSQGHIEIVGAGPGDPELVSVRGKRFLQTADLILYAGSLVPKELTYYAKPSCMVRSSADMDLEEQFNLMKEYYDRGKLVVRLHTGDPCIYGAIQEQMAYFDAHHMDYHITPGISSFLAAAAELKSQFTIPERCQSIILTRGEGRTPMPEKEKLHMLAEHQSTMCIFLSASIVDDVQRQLLEGGYPPETPVAACYKLTWKDQRIYRGQLKDLAKILKENNLTLTTMIVVGDAIDNRQGLSKLYDGHFTHMFRKGK